MESVNPTSHITDFDPTDEAILDSSGWYDWQYLTEFADMDQLPWLLSQGWIVFDTESAQITDDDGSTRWKVIKASLKRRVLKPEQALQDLIPSITAAYNEGRTANDQRYDDIVAIYSAMVSGSETDFNALETSDGTYDGLIEALITALNSDFSSHNTSVSGALATWGASERQRIDTAFDNRIAAVRADMISRGIHNTTTYDSILAGIERERAIADTDLEDKILERQVAEENRLYEQKTTMRSKVLAARDRLRAGVEDRDVRRIDLRNNILKAMTAFMERREDSYPDISSVSKLASTLGAHQPSYHSP